MAAAERMTITLPAEMAETLRQTVAGGEYASTSEVVREALREWTRARNAERRDLDALRTAIKAGLDSGQASRPRRSSRSCARATRTRVRMARLVVLPAARLDLIEIADFIAADDPERAVTFVAEIEARMAQAA